MQNAYSPHTRRHGYDNHPQKPHQRRPTLNDYASIAADALAAINAINAAWSKSERAGGYAANFRTRPSIHEELELQLYEAITDFDCDPQGTLDELRFQNEPRERDIKDWGGELAA
jgi:hypothetical protein